MSMDFTASIQANIHVDLPVPEGKLAYYTEKQMIDYANAKCQFWIDQLKLQEELTLAAMKMSG